MNPDQSSDVATVALLRRAVPLTPPGPGPDLDTVLRAGAARRARAVRGREALAASATAAVAVLAVVAGSTALGGGGGGGEDGGRDVPVAGAPEQVVERLSLLGEPAGPEDSLPSPGMMSRDLMEPGTARLVADVDGVQVFAGTDADGLVCVEVHQRFPGMSSASCLALADFEQNGAGFSFEDETSRVQGVLLPDSWSLDGSDQRLSDATNPGAGLSLEDVVAPNLVLRVTNSSGAAVPGTRSARDEMALLSRPATAEDRLPTTWSTGEEVGDMGVEVGSSRLLARTEGVAHVAGTDGEGQVCVLVHAQDLDSVGSSCATPARFAAAGVWTVLGGPAGEQVTALLLPDRFDTTDLASLPDGVLRAGDLTLGADDLLAPHLLGRNSGGGGGAGP